MGEAEIKCILADTRYLYPQIKRVTSADIGEWSDDHPLNSVTKCDAEYKRLFGGAA